VGPPAQRQPGLRIPNMLDAAVDGSFKAIYIQGEDILQSDPNTHHVAAGLGAMECVVVQDLFLNETANYAHVFLPGSTFLEKDGTFTNAERRIQRVRRVMTPRNGGYADWEITQLIAKAIGLDWSYAHPSQIMDEISKLTPSFRGVTRQARGVGLRAMALQRSQSGWITGDAHDNLRPRQGQVHADRVRADRRANGTALPPAADHGPHPFAVQRRRADTAYGERRLARGGSPGDQPA
jgi:anaerobic selenocysteine-containing dehydrogenase